MNDNNTNINSNEWEQRGRDFLLWVSDNEKELKKAVRKNITYIEDIFEDVWSSALLKVYDAIVKRHVEIDNLKNYVFTSVKWEYIQWHNRQRRNEQTNLPNHFDDDHNDIIEEEDIEEERFSIIESTLSRLRAVLTDEFGEDKTTLFFQYYTAKSERMVSYKKVADSLGISGHDLGETIRQMKQFVASHPDFRNFKITL